MASDHRITGGEKLEGYRSLHSLRSTSLRDGGIKTYKTDGSKEEVLSSNECYDGKATPFLGLSDGTADSYETGALACWYESPGSKGAAEKDHKAPISEDDI